jgi:hypothetical protein
MATLERRDRVPETERWRYHAEALSLKAVSTVEPIMNGHLLKLPRTVLSTTGCALVAIAGYDSLRSAK